MFVQVTMNASQNSYSKVSELPISLIDIIVPQIFCIKKNNHLNFFRVMHTNTQYYSKEENHSNVIGSSF